MGGYAHPEDALLRRVLELHAHFAAVVVLVDAGLGLGGVARLLRRGGPFRQEFHDRFLRLRPEGRP